MATLQTETGISVDREGFAAMVGCDPARVPAACSRTLAAANLAYEPATGREVYELLLDAFGASDGARPAGRRGCRAAAVLPRRIRPGVVRLRGDYAHVADAGFEGELRAALLHYCAARWFAGCRAVTEFGRGSTANLALLARALPTLELRGCAPDPSPLLRRRWLAARPGGEIEVRRFDLLAPDPAMALGVETGVLTSTALQPLGHEHGAFVDYLLDQRPVVCVHIEPIYELYDENVVFDDVARQYHRHEGYLRGFVPRLRELAAARRVELLEVRRTGFGPFLHEPYGLVVWRPARDEGASGNRARA